MAEKHDWLLRAYIGSNRAHQVFTEELATQKVFAAFASQKLKDWLAELGQQMRADAQSQGGGAGMGIITRVYPDTKRLQGIFIPYNQSIVVTENPHGALSQFYGQLYTDLHRLLVSYLMDLYGEIARKQPRILMSRKNLTFEEVVAAHERNELIELIIEKQQTNLSHMDRLELESEFESLGLPLREPGLTPPDDEIDRQYLEFWPNRNILEHNRGYVNQLYLKKLPNSARTIGDRVVIDLEAIGATIALVQAIAESLNRRAVAKYALA
jgi:hypothetical protein